MATQQAAVTKQEIQTKTVGTIHPLYNSNLDKWTKCRDAVAGSDAIKAKGRAYLPKLPGHYSDTTDRAYNDYKDRANFYGAVKRTIKGMVGMVFMKNPTVENLPPKMEYLLDDITFTGIPLSGFAKIVFREVMEMGRAGIWVDMPKVGAAEQRPYMILYSPEQIINWRQERINGKMITTLVVLSETQEETDPADVFTTKQYDQYRVLQLEREDPETGAAYIKPRYVVRIFRALEETTEKSVGYFMHDEIYPTKNGVNLDYIPFEPLGPEENSFAMQLPPIMDMVEVVLSHYRTSADLENGRHWCGIPQPYLCGFPDKKEWQIGGNQIWQTTDPTAKAEFMEFKGSGLSALERALEEKETKLAVLGMRLLESQKKGAEQPEALRLRMLGDISTLEGIVVTVSQGLTKALKWMGEWMSDGADVNKILVKLNTDYNESILNAQDLQSLITLWQSEGISYRTLYHNLRRGEITREGVDSDDELDQINEEREEMEKLNRGRPVEEGDLEDIKKKNLGELNTGV